MAKNAFPMKTGGALGKIVSVVVVLAVLTLVVKHPADTAHWVVGVFHMIGNAIDAISTFLQKATS
jgi:hypothetical protein